MDPETDLEQEEPRGDVAAVLEDAVGAVGARVMALDVGKVRIGVALTDPLGYTAQPLLTVWRKSPGEDVRSVLRLIRRHGVTVLVVGHPLHLSGDPIPFGEKVRAFAAELEARCGLPVHLFDERLTTVEAHAQLDAAGYGTRGRNRVIDQVAAVVILQDWMQEQAHAAARAR